jgi:Arc/MetJ-type ribon-helix-helix transcriptional regulator
MAIHLPEDLQRFIRSQVESGLFDSEDEAIVEAVRRVKRWEQERVADPPVPGPVPAWQRVLENMKDVPDAAFDRVPSDSSEQLDHYLYGTPRRPTS